jgi:hypothetical protein
MDFYISFDVSSKTIGYASFIISSKIEKLKIAYFSPEKKGTEFARLISLKNDISRILKLIKMDPFFSKSDNVYISIEQSPLFIPHKSTAATIVKLNIYTRIVGLTILEELGIEPKFISVQTIRATLKKLSKSLIKIEKSCVPNALEIIVSNINKEQWSFPYIKDKQNETRLVKRGKKIGDYIEQNFDMADALAVGLTHAYKNKSIK